MSLSQINTHAYKEGLPYTDWNALAADMNQIVADGAGFVPGAFKLWDSVDAGVTLPAASVTTPSLDQNFSHLLVIFKARSATATSIENLHMRVNGSSAAAYYDQVVQGNAAAASAGESVGATSMKVGTLAGGSVGATYTGVGCIWLPYYAETTAYKNYTSISGGNRTNLTGHTYEGVFGGFFGSGGAISTLTFLSQGGGNIVTPSRFTVYGLS